MLFKGSIPEVYHFGPAIDVPGIPSALGVCYTPSHPAYGVNQMALSDERVIEFLWKSPLKSFRAMLDALRYLDRQWVQLESEGELFDWALGDNPQEKIQIRIPPIGGIPANALLHFMRHAKSFNVIRRRERKPQGLPEESEEIIVFYELTPSGSYMLKVLEVLTDVSVLAERNLSA